MTVTASVMDTVQHTAGSPNTRIDHTILNDYRVCRARAAAWYPRVAPKPREQGSLPRIRAKRRMRGSEERTTAKQLP